MRFSSGLLKAEKGPFAGKMFYPEAERDVVSRVQFRLITWQGEESEEHWERGGWWHFDSVLWDSEGVHLYTEVTSLGAELVQSYPWPKVDEAVQERRDEELYEDDRAWVWISEVLAEPLGLCVLDEDGTESEPESFQKELSKRGAAEFAD